MTQSNPAVATFVEEARELIEGLEAQLLDLERDANADAVDSVFRVLHTIKGSGAMFGFTELSRFTHHLEEAFDRVREGRARIDQRLIDLALDARDHMKALLDLGEDGDGAASLATGPQGSGLIARLTALVGSSDTPTIAPDAAQGGTTAAAAPERLWQITFRPARNALRNGMRPDLLISELRDLGRLLSCRADVRDVPDLDDLDPLTSYLGWTVRLATAEPRATIEAVFIFADDAELAITEVSAEASRVPADGTDPAPPAERLPRQADSVGETIRVPASRLDEIVDQLGELVICHARLEGLAERLGNPDLEALSEEMGRLVGSLREATLAIRMLPIETVFGKFRRVVRDLSAELGKEVTLLTQGGETEIDKNVIDRLTEPLVHMIRNAVDHGIEDGDLRRQRGKTARGTVQLSASQEGGEVLITISDDGGGLDAAAIRAKAIARGLIGEEATPTDHDLYQLIFAPGFSTAANVTKVSGRGVGMDAVKTAIEALRGTVDLSSQPGKGARFTLRLPVSLAIIDGLLVRLGAETFVIPLAAVEECVELDDVERRRASGRTMMQIRETLVPWLDLDQVFARAPSGMARRRLVVVRCDGLQIGLIVDDIVGQHQTVIKTFSAYHRGVEGLSGATILGDGTVALIIDVASLARRAVAEARITIEAA
ncbi:MAG: chemotaxis protein CheA [Rhodobacteraceae bacterium]|nr:chemotaxis protein CheA [Paracoccaceae bacterium]